MMTNATIFSSANTKSIAHLARLGLGNAEVEQYARQLSAFFGHVQALAEIDTTTIVPIAQVTGLSTVFRPDTSVSSVLSVDLQNCSPHGVEADGHIRVHSVF